MARQERGLHLGRGDNQNIASGEVRRGDRRRGIGFGRQRDPDTKKGSCARRAFNGDAAAHALDDAPADRKSQPGAAKLVRPVGVALLEFEENPLLLVERDSDPGVPHSD